LKRQLPLSVRVYTATGQVSISLDTSSPCFQSETCSPLSSVEITLRTFTRLLRQTLAVFPGTPYCHHFPYFDALSLSLSPTLKLFVFLKERAFKTRSIQTRKEKVFSALSFLSKTETKTRPLQNARENLARVRPPHEQWYVTTCATNLAQQTSCACLKCPPAYGYLACS
jgi:hypothetical protein